MLCATLIATKFTDMGSKMTSFGYRLRDDDGEAFGDHWSEREMEQILQSSPAEERNLVFLQRVLETESSPILDRIRRYRLEMRINDTWYSWEEIKHLWIAVGMENPDPNAYHTNEEGE
jgi:hypothetical protein